MIKCECKLLNFKFIVKKTFCAHILFFAPKFIPILKPKAKIDLF